MELKRGHYKTGAEAIGCCNTGRAACIANSKSAAKYLGKPYVVGYEIEVTFNLTDNILLAMRGKSHHAKFYKSKALAVKEFERLNGDMLKYNSQELSHIKELKTKARAGDIGAVLALGDY